MRLVVTRPLPIDAAEAAGAGIEVVTLPHDRAPTRAELLQAAQGADGLVTLLSDGVDEALLSAAPRLKVVANVAVGLDNVDLAACAARGVAVTHTPDALTAATADLTWALILAVARRVVEGDRMMREQRYTGWSPTLLLGKELDGATLGIVGFGRIGQAVARRAGGFGMQVLYTARSPAPEAVARSLQARETSLDELIGRADVVSIHCPLTSATHHLFSAARLRSMRPGSLLINTSRGPVVDEAALAAALEHGPLAGAGLDVFEHEPQVHPALLGRSDVVLLPHLGSATRATREKMARAAVGDAARVLRGESPLHPAPSLPLGRPPST